MTCSNTYAIVSDKFCEKEALPVLYSYIQKLLNDAPKQREDKSVVEYKSQFTEKKKQPLKRNKL